MGFNERGRTCVAIALLCTACRFETGPLSPQGDLAPSEASGDAPARASGFDNPSADPGTGAVASPSTMANAGGPASAARADAASQPPAAQAGSASEQAGSPAAAGAAPPAAEPDAAAPEPDPAHPAPDAATTDPLPDPDAGSAPDPVVPIAGAPFSECISDAHCGEGLICTSTLAALGGMTGQPGYCAARCDWSTGTGTCAQPASGLVKANCQLGGMLCLLASCERSVCPNGLRCVETQTPIGAGQVVTFFACQP